MTDHPSAGLKRYSPVGDNWEDFQMQMKTKDLKPGIVMSSGEIVMSAVQSDCWVKMVVRLWSPRKQRERTAAWNYNGTVFVKSTEKVDLPA